MLNMSICSKNRACQLELFIRSMKLFFKEWTSFKLKILYTFTNDSYQKGYELIQKLHPEPHYIKQKNFRQDWLSMIDPNLPYTMFFVDDMCWKESFSICSPEFQFFSKLPDIACLSLRMHPYINYCYVRSRSTPPPQFNIKPYIWDYGPCLDDWGYCNSMDGHIYKTIDILPIIKTLPFNNPNDFEGYWSQYPIPNKPKMMCFEKSPLMNIPINKVQTANDNKNGNIDPAYLNSEFLNGRYLSIDNIVGFNNISPHQEVPIHLISCHIR